MYPWRGAEEWHPAGQIASAINNGIVALLTKTWVLGDGGEAGLLAGGHNLVQLAQPLWPLLEPGDYAWRWKKAMDARGGGRRWKRVSDGDWVRSRISDIALAGNCLPMEKKPYMVTTCGLVNEWRGGTVTGAVMELW